MQVKVILPEYTLLCSFNILLIFYISKKIDKKKKQSLKVKKELKQMFHCFKLYIKLVI